MATFDRLPAEQRAIIELVLQQGQTYEDLSGMLGMPTSRVRDLAREALAELAPVTARRVDREWRGQLADYVLGQQSGPEATATRGHLRRSETARAWARSLLDSLDGLYKDEVPTVPEGDREPGRGRGRRGGAVTEEPPERERRERPARERPLSAEQALRRRRILAAAAATAVVLFAVLVFPIGLLTGDDDDDGGGGSDGQQAQARVVGQIVLKPERGEEGAGIAVIAERGGKPQLIVQARLDPNKNRQAYEVWLYNSPDDARSLGAQVTDRQGTYQGAGPLPEDYERYKFIDISREKVDENRKHSNDSVLRGRLDQLQPADAGQAGQGTAPPAGGQGTPTAP